jgi:thiamine pyrophosphokinase
LDELGYKNIACFGSLGGRLDHTLSSMHNVIKVSKTYKDIKIWLIGKSSMMYYITPERHIIHLKTDLIYKKYCGLVPFGKVN